MAIPAYSITAVHGVMRNAIRSYALVSHAPPTVHKKVKTIKHKDRKLNETLWHFLLPAIAFHNYYSLTYNIYLRTQTS